MASTLDLTTLSDFELAKLLSRASQEHFRRQQQTKDSVTLVKEFADRNRLRFQANVVHLPEATVVDINLFKKYKLVFRSSYASPAGEGSQKRAKIMAAAEMLSILKANGLKVGGYRRLTDEERIDMLEKGAILDGQYDHEEDDGTPLIPPKLSLEEKIKLREKLDAELDVLLEERLKVRGRKD